MGGGMGGGGGFGATPPDMFGGRQAYNPFTFEGGGFTGTGPRAGGVDGRGGMHAIVHPNETIIDHSQAMNRYNGGNSFTGASMTRTIHFQSEVINNVEYVTAEQAQRMTREAADDGARRGAASGHSRTMRTLQNSRSSRAKLGMR